MKNTQHKVNGISDIDKAIEYYMDHYNGKCVKLSDTSKYSIYKSSKDFTVASYGTIEISPVGLKDELSKVNKVGDIFNLKVGYISIIIFLMNKAEDTLVTGPDYVMFNIEDIILNFYNPYVDQECLSEERKELNVNSLYPTKDNPLVNFEFISKSTFNKLNFLVEADIIKIKNAQKREAEENKKSVLNLRAAVRYFMENYNGKVYKTIAMPPEDDFGPDDVIGINVSKINVSKNELAKAYSKGEDEVCSTDDVNPIEIQLSADHKINFFSERGEYGDLYFLQDFYNPYINYAKYFEGRSKKIFENPPTEEHPVIGMTLISPDEFKKLTRLVDEFRNATKIVNGITEELNNLII